MYNVPDEHIPSDEDMDRLNDGDQSVVNPLIEGLVSFIITEMDWFIKENPTLAQYKDDIISEAFLALVQTVNKMLGSRYSPNQFIGYIKKVCIASVIRSTMELRLPVTVPEGSLLQPDIRAGLDEVRETTRPIKERDSQTPNNSLFGEIWFDDFMSSLDEADEIIIRMRLGGSSFKKIGEAISVQNEAFITARLKSLLDIYGDEDE